MFAFNLHKLTREVSTIASPGLQTNTWFEASERGARVPPGGEGAAMPLTVINREKGCFLKTQLTSHIPTKTLIQMYRHSAVKQEVNEVKPT